jgi:uncharacterized protein
MLNCKALLIKSASRCNLNCSYCYMYNTGDLSYKIQPKFMSDETVDMLLYRVVEHCKEHGIKNFLFSFHGGEPMLAGINFHEKFIVKANKLLKSIDVKPIYSIQTNGVLLNDEWCRFFEEHQVITGVSIDGTKENNDKYRVDHKNRGSYDRIIKGIHTMVNYSKDSRRRSGLLSVVNLDEDPIVVYNHFKQLNVPLIDFLFPLYNHDNNPNKDESLGETPYADWLLKMFYVWFNDKDSNRPIVRTFSGFIEVLLGGRYPVDFYGSTKSDLLVIETNGGIEAVDALKICGDSFTKSGANVHTHSFNEALNTPLAKTYHLSHEQLPKKCQKCDVNEICGGGYLPTRFKSLNGFNNETIYCKDLLKLISVIQNEVLDQIPKDFKENLKMDYLDYESILKKISQTYNDKHVQTDEFFEVLESFKK